MPATTARPLNGVKKTIESDAPSAEILAWRGFVDAMEKVDWPTPGAQPHLTPWRRPALGLGVVFSPRRETK